MKFAILTAICLFMLTIVVMGESRALSEHDLLSVTTTADRTGNMHLAPRGNSQEISVKIKPLTGQIGVATGEYGKDPIILLAIGITMSGIALWGSKRYSAS